MKSLLGWGLASVGKSLSTADMIGATTPKKSTSALVDQSPSALVAESLSAPAAKPSTAATAETERFAKIAVFVKPDQRQWLKETVRQLPVDGLSVSDLVRLAVDRLQADVDDDELLKALTSQAHADAERFAGRRNRGLPARN